MAQAAQREIRVTYRIDNGMVTLNIQDTGPGLDPQALTQAGSPFFTTKQTGLGLGLSISRTIAVQHGGTLTIGNMTDKNAGGAVVKLSLPVVATPYL